MRVTHIVKAAGIGGCERHLLDLLPALGDRGVDADLVVLVAPGGDRFAAAARARGIRVRRIYAGLDADPRTVAHCAQALRLLPTDLVHTHLIHADVHGQLAARIGRVRAVSTIHSTHAFYRREPVRSAARVAGRLARRTIAISAFAADYVREVRLAPRERVRVVPYGVDVTVFDDDASRRARARAEFGVRDGDVAVLAASRLITGKGHDLLIDACRQVTRTLPHVRLLIAGEGPLREQLLARASAAGENVRFLGFVDDVPGLFAAADIVAFTTQPALGEGFGLAALEAHAAARPVVATAVASLPEIVVDCKTGVLVEPGDVGALARAIEVLAANDSTRQRLGHAGRRRAAESFSLDAMAERTIEVYEEALA
jgi:glycosyltransferase involved in cell wall biosynthesis